MTDATMIDLPQRPRSRRAANAEYATYFALILALSLPVAALCWLADAARGAPGRGPLARALSQARTITPVIFMG